MRRGIGRPDMDQRTRPAAQAGSEAPGPPVSPEVSEVTAKKSELRAFLFLTVVMAPALAGVIVATYGLAVWIYQMFAGPPTG